jgi:uncharacterized protein (DUF111 family)
MGKPEQKDGLMNLLFKESTTLGVRFRYSRRKILERTVIEMDSPWGKIHIKKVSRPDGSSLFLPEYEECCRIAKQSGSPLMDVYFWVTSLNRA